ncbi:restriction endonuclease subunit S [Methylomonas albis]|uniref:Restriction endonuclease subunit S n=1 Tax=Methylomonas albis TaxID=1854563 RepID=A0ABR9CXH6_9GAMM|nr:restriction endonuclease subunit S [Methylomonas albis]MBD9355226.1 restriction endonuclease subunit S [Methylomonas albis]
MSRLPEVPSTWTITKLGEVVDYDKTVKVEPNKIESSAWVLELEDIEKHTSKLLARCKFSDRGSKSTKNHFEIGDVLYGKLRPYLNKVLIADQAGYCSTEIIPLKTNDNLGARFLFYWLKHPAFLDYVEAESHGLNMPRLGTETGRAAPFVFAPHNEQKRIADKLDAVLARVDTCRDRLDRIPAIIKRFRQSVVSYATDGGLTEDWRTQKYGCADKLIAETNLQDLCYRDRVITYGVIKLGDDIANGVPCLRTSNVRWLKFENDGMKKIAQSLSNEYSRTILQGNEVLVNVRGTLGGVAVATSDMAGWNVSREVAVIPGNITTVNPQFLALWIGADRSQRWLSGVERGVAYTGINLEDLRTLPVAIPKLDEQIEIVRRVESLFAYADRLEARYQAARTQVEKLTPALLAKAFRGELVPQDPNDEPASELLARIAARKIDALAKKRAGKMSKSTA